jgi:RHS repeat-associated protein
MKREVILLLFLVVCMPISYAEVIDIPGITKGEGAEPDVPLDESGVKKFVYAGNNIVASVEDSNVKYYHKAVLSNSLTTKTDGGIDSEFKSLPFGQKIANSGVDYPFTGKEEDESGLYYFGARYYDDNLGRFTVVDPVKENQPYAYVKNNPMNYVDPTGMEELRNGAWAELVDGEFVWHNPPMEESIPDSTEYSFYTMGAGEWVWGHVLPLTPEGRTSVGDTRLRELNAELYDRRGGWEGIQPGDIIKYEAADSDTFYANRQSRLREEWLVGKFMEFLNDPRWSMRYENTAIRFLQGQGLSYEESQDFLFYNSPPAHAMGAYGNAKFSRGLYDGVPVVYDYNNIGLKATVDIRVSGGKKDAMAGWIDKILHIGDRPDTTNIRLGELVDPYYMEPDVDDWGGER